jgi:glycerol kinase
MLMNLYTLGWDQEILSILGIPGQILPEVKPSINFYGYAKSDVYEIPISGDLGDQQAALFGQACFQPGEAKNTYGTGCFMLLNTGYQPVESKSGLLTTLGYKIGDLPAIYALEGSIAIAGSLVQWLRDHLHIITKSSEIEALAKTVEDNGGIYFVPAFSGLFAPYWRTDARGVIAGITSYVNSGHLARAVLEATAYQTKEIFDAMESDSGVKLESLRVDGGMIGNELLMQFQSDILNVTVVKPQIAETTALGAAYAAGLAINFWSGLEELKSNWAVQKEWKPQMENEKRERLFSGWKKAVSKTFNWM